MFPAPSRAEAVISDITSSMATAVAAVASDDLVTALGVITSLQARTTAWQQLPAHHQRRLAMEQLGLVKLPHIDVPFATLAAASSSLPFIEDDLDSIPDSTVYALLCRRSSSDFYEHTRLTCTEFLILYQELRPFIVKPRDADMDADCPETHRVRYSHRKLHPVDELLLWLYHADGNKHTVLCLLFDIDRTSITVITDHVTRAMNEAWKDEVRWPSRCERAEMHGFFSCHPKAVGCIDGTHCRIDVPDAKDDEESCYSPYKKYHTLNYLLCCDAFGFILHIAGPYPGSMNDKQCFYASDFMNPDCHMLDADERLITDGGFDGFSMNIHPFSTTQMELVNAEERAIMVSWNEEIVLNRSLNEHVNHQLKARAQALAGKWSRSMVRQRDVFLVAARFSNRVKRLRVEYRLYCLQLHAESN
jgi:hypothetical protein